MDRRCPDARNGEIFFYSLRDTGQLPLGAAYGGKTIAPGLTPQTSPPTPHASQNAAKFPTRVMPDSSASGAAYL